LRFHKIAHDSSSGWRRRRQDARKHDAERGHAKAGEKLVKISEV
jgi:hypothetical protein